MNTATRPIALADLGALRYGENAWQGADLFHHWHTADPLAVGKFVLEEGELPSATNLTDLDRGIHTLTHAVAALETNGLRNRDVAIALKHGNCCGAGHGQNVEFTLQRMIDGDRQAILGGVILCNFNIDRSGAHILLHYGSESRRLLDVIVAPSFSEEARTMLTRKAGKCRLISNPTLKSPHLNTALRCRAVRQGHVVQDPDNKVLDFKDPDLRTYGNENDWLTDDLAFASAICRTSNSNTITLVHNKMLIGQGVGQTRRDRAARLAVSIALETGHRRSDEEPHKLPEGTVACSDSFFPFADGVEPLIKAGVQAIFSTSGAMRDGEVQKACIDAGVTLYQLPDKEARMFFGH